MEKVLLHSTGNATSLPILGQFNFQDNTPHMMHVLKSIDLEECNAFLEKSAALLKKYTKGYGLWAYRNYRQSEIFNGSFLLGLEGWKSQKGGEGSIEIEGGFLLLSGLDDKSFAKVEQGVKQLPEQECDGGNTNMEVCFRYRMKGDDRVESSGNAFHVVWNGKKVDQLLNHFAIWTAKCLRIQSLDANKFYAIGFLVEGTASVNIDNVEVSGHTHSLYTNTVNNEPIATCGDGLISLNRLLG